MGDNQVIGAEWDGILYDSSGIYTNIYSTTNGCDSIINTNLLVGSSSVNSQNITICNGQSYTVGSNSYSVSGNYSDTITFGGCDSIINTNLLVLNNTGYQQTISLCLGESFSVGSNTYTQNGIYIDTLNSYNGCDSIVTTNLSFFNNYNSTSVLSVCYGDTINVGGNSYYSPGNYSDTLSTFNGCDSIVNINLTVFPTLYEYLSYTICDGDSITVGNNIYYNSGSFSDTLLSTFNCDSIIYKIEQI